jgi:hypothetical protein
MRASTPASSKSSKSLGQLSDPPLIRFNRYNEQGTG